MLAILAGGHFVSLRAAAVIRLRVVEGEGAVYAPGSRATRSITVQVTDETGQPLDAVAVSFRLPEEGAGGTFASGLRTEIVTTKADGRATVWGMRWNRTPGPFEVRVTAAKDQARAGIVISQFLSDRVAAGAGGTGEFHTSHSYKKWLMLGAAVGAGALGGMLVVARRSEQSAATAVPGPPVIGAPSIAIGPHP